MNAFTASYLKKVLGTVLSILAINRDHAAWCPYCQKVWIQLEEKQIPYVIEKINMRCYGDKPADYVAKVRAGNVQVLTNASASCDYMPPFASVRCVHVGDQSCQPIQQFLSLLL